MDAEHFRRVADVPLRSLQRARDEHLLELTPRVVVENSLFEKFLDEPVELITHGQRSSRPDKSRNASRYFSRVWRTTSSGSDGTGGCLFQRMRSTSSRTYCLAKLGCPWPGSSSDAGQNRDESGVSTSSIRMISFPSS